MSDTTLHKVASTSDLDEDEAMQVLGGEFFALDDICTHAYASMADGYIEGDCIECPLHGAQFNIRTGKAETPPATEDLKSYEVTVDGEDILVAVASS